MDSIRRLFRGFLGADSYLYKVGAEVLNFLFIAQQEGLETWRILRGCRDKSRLSDLPKSVVLRNLEYPIIIRPGTQDADTVIDNVIREEYGNFTPVRDPEWMIDAGAYIGDTAAYFLSRFPNLKVIALEPNIDAHKIASQNLRPYGDRVILLKKGLFSSEGIKFFAGDGTAASISNSGQEIECVTVSSLINQYSIPRLDILKMDIEGAEESVFLSNPETWLDRTDLLIIEIHGPHINSLVSHVLSESKFSMEHFRSVWYCAANSGRMTKYINI